MPSSPLIGMYVLVPDGELDIVTFIKILKNILWKETLGFCLSLTWTPWCPEAEPGLDLSQQALIRQYIMFPNRPSVRLTGLLQYKT